VRRPKVEHESRTLGLERNELESFLVQAGLGSPRDHALASLLALNGLRISEALGAEMDGLDFERGQRTLKVLRKDVTIPLAPRTSRALGLYIGAHGPGPSSSAPRADAWTTADRMVSRLAPGERRSPSGSARTACGLDRLECRSVRCVL